MDLEIYKTFHSKATKHIFKCIWNILQDRSYVRPQKVLINLRRLKLYQAAFLTTMIWNKTSITEEDYKIHRHVAINQHTAEQQIGQRRNQKQTLKKSWDKWKWKSTYQNLWNSKNK